MRTHILAFLFLVSNISVSISQISYTVETIPNPKIVSDRYFVSNPDHVIDDATEQHVNLLLKALEDSTTAQVAVVIVNSIGDAVPKEFATALFRKWGVGQKENNNGLLILMVIDQRRMEFETGYGLEPILTDALCKRIQVEYMVPRAKEGDYNTCVLDGVREVIKVIINPIYRDEVTAQSIVYAEELKPWYRKIVSPVAVFLFIIIYGISILISWVNRNTRLKKAPDYIKNNYNPTYYNTKFFLVNIVIPTAFIVYEKLTGNLRVAEFSIFIYIFFALLLIERRIRVNNYIHKSANADPYKSYTMLAQSHKGWLGAAIFFPLPFIFYYFFNKNKLLNLRNTPPLCPDCNTPMIKLSETADDNFLEKYELTEEQLHSVDYDVWKCTIAEHEHVKILRYENYWSKYTACPQCHAKAYEMIKNETIVSPTYSSSGEGKKTYQCKSCLYKKATTYTIAKLTHSSSSGGSGGSGGGGGGGFGGGSSGGGGAGSSW